MLRIMTLTTALALCAATGNAAGWARNAAGCANEETQVHLNDGVLEIDELMCAADDVADGKLTCEDDEGLTSRVSASMRAEGGRAVLTVNGRSVNLVPCPEPEPVPDAPDEEGAGLGPSPSLAEIMGEPAVSASN